MCISEKMCSSFCSVFFLFKVDSFAQKTWQRRSSHGAAKLASFGPWDAHWSHSDKKIPFLKKLKFTKIVKMSPEGA